VLTHERRLRIEDEHETEQETDVTDQSAVSRVVADHQASARNNLNVIVIRSAGSNAKVGEAPPPSKAASYRNPQQVYARNTRYVAEANKAPMEIKRSSTMADHLSEHPLPFSPSETGSL
jgi:hypothetical protein